MPKQVNHDLKREAFAEAAYRVIQKHGLAGATMQAVAREAGFTTGALVHYLSSRDELLLAAADVAAKITRNLMRKRLQNLTGIEALRQMMYLSLPLGKERQGAWNVRLGYWERASQNANVRALIHERYTESNARFVEIIESAQQLGELPDDVDPSRAAHSATALLDGIGVQVLLAGHKISPAFQHALVEDWISGTFNLKRPGTRAPRATIVPKKLRSPAHLGEKNGGTSRRYL